MKTWLVSCMVSFRVQDIVAPMISVSLDPTIAPEEAESAKALSKGEKADFCSQWGLRPPEQEAEEDWRKRRRRRGSSPAPLGRRSPTPRSRSRSRSPEKKKEEEDDLREQRFN